MSETLEQLALPFRAEGCDIVDANGYRIFKAQGEAVNNPEFARCLTEQQEPVKYGCHCDIENTVSGKPDECVFDNGDICDCIYAVKLQKEGKGKTDCSYYKPISAQPQAEQQEPVAWRVDLTDSSYLIDDIDDPQAVDDLTNADAILVPLYAAPPALPEANAAMVMVPREPTESQVVEGEMLLRCMIEAKTSLDVRLIYSAMIMVGDAALREKEEG